jgi:sulfur dioxygenase
MNSFHFQQLFEPESFTYTYLLADSDTKEAILIDPVLETVNRDLKLINDLGFKLTTILETHVHADHITGAGKLRKATGAKVGVSVHAKLDCVDISLTDGMLIQFGSFKLKVLETPGHTNGCLSFHFKHDNQRQMLFSGDALLIRAAGRTDFQQGSSPLLYQSITQKMFTLPDDTLVYPAHDYNGVPFTTIGLEKRLNPRVGGGKSQEEFVSIMANLKLAQPKKIHESVPANMKCGEIMNQNENPVIQPPVIHPNDVLLNRKNKTLARLIDVRNPDEFTGELGHVAGSELITLGEPLTHFLKTGNPDQEIVFICRSGNRSGKATLEALALGYRHVRNMTGGMILWNELKLPVAR